MATKAPEKITKPKDRDFLNHLETYLSKRDGVDKLLKISRYATKIILASSLIPETRSIIPRLKSFESSVGVSRKAFRLGKFVQDINALRSSRWDSNHELVLLIIAYGGEGLYYFVEQFIWLTKSGLIDAKHSKWLQKISAWAELVGYVGSVSIKIRDLRKLNDEESCVASTIEISLSRGLACDGEDEKMKMIKEKKTLKVLSILQDLADGLMTIADIRDGKGVLSAPNVISSAGLFSAIVSTHKNWISC
ncbi:Peroxisomal membrane protein 11A [Arabidopsis thaliana]|uniref:PEX11A n=2 Tax=Arabidopsis TaxID=3701 RepID=A0A178W7Y4_ARATH|nr:Peroxisomal biogenesis factor 11 [Arabidopsis thaliana x Arabidopsis arenosa]OAP13172.1 PEX11A [Arabidopsis thaliana]